MRTGAAEQPPDDARLGKLGPRPPGVVARPQLLGLGFSSQAIKTLVARERLHRLHLGVYAVGHERLTAKGRWMAAVLGCWSCRVLHPPADATVVDAIPVTTLARTYLDLAELLSHNRLIDALEAGQRQDKLDVSAITATIHRNPGRHGIPALRAAIAGLTDTAPLLQSDLERAFRAIIRDHGLPMPQFNVY